MLLIMKQMKKAESVIEKVKEDNQLEEIQKMNSIHNRAEEIVLNEIIIDKDESWISRACQVRFFLRFDN